MQDSIYIGAAPETKWPLTVESVERQLRERFPEVRCFQHAPEGDEKYLNFEVTLGGEVRHGSYFDRSTLILKDGPPELWMDTIAWFLGLLPAGMQAVAMVEVNPEEIAPIPHGTDAAAVRELLDRLSE